MAYFVGHCCQVDAQTSIAPSTPQPLQGAPVPAPTVNVDRKTGSQHKLSGPMPTYPSFARQTGVSGDVLLQAQVDTGGHVTAVTVVSGPTLLLDTAVQTVKQWVYKPFEQNGQNVNARVEVTIGFRISSPNIPPNPVLQEFGPTYQKCVLLMRENADISKQVDACGKAAKVADRFPPGINTAQRVSAYVHSADTLFRYKQPKEALARADQAVELVKEGTDEAFGSAAAYALRAEIRENGGNFEGASQDLSQAEMYHRQAISTSSAEDATRHAAMLRSLLHYDASILKGSQEA